MTITCRPHGIPRLLVDPQLYAHSIPGGSARCHQSNGLEITPLTPYIGPDDVEKQVKTVIEVNERLKTSRIIAPAPNRDLFADAWGTLSFQYTHKMLSHADRPVLASIVAQATAFADWDETSRYLDAITKLDIDGFYLLVGADSTTYPQRWNPHQLANVFRVIYRLGLINRYDIVWGYSDLAGFVGTLLGASGSATGWYHSLRLWSREKWQPRSGGRQAKPRYFVAPLLSSVQREPEALDVASSNLAETVFPEPNELSTLREEAPYGAADAWQQHLNAMARLHASTPRSGNVVTQLQDFQTRVGTAIELFEHLESEGIVWTRQYRTSLRTLRDSIDSFVALENL